jgi:hypothetical protein
MLYSILPATAMPTPVMTTKLWNNQLVAVNDWRAIQQKLEEEKRDSPLREVTFSLVNGGTIEEFKGQDIPAIESFETEENLFDAV